MSKVLESSVVKTFLKAKSMNKIKNPIEGL